MLKALTALALVMSAPAFAQGAPAGDVPSKAAVHRLVTVTLAGVRPDPAAPSEHPAHGDDTGAPAHPPHHHGHHSAHAGHPAGS